MEKVVRTPNKALAVDSGIPRLSVFGYAWPATTEAHR